MVEFPPYSTKELYSAEQSSALDLVCFWVLWVIRTALPNGERLLSMQ